MAPLGQRILWRAVPVGIATALAGWLLLQLYVPIAQTLYPDLQVQEGGVEGSLRGVLIFGLAGFALVAAIECVRRESNKNAARPRD